MCMCVLGVPGTAGGQKKALEHLELESQGFVHLCVAHVSLQVPVLSTAGPPLQVLDILLFFSENRSNVALPGLELRDSPASIPSAGLKAPLCSASLSLILLRMLGNSYRFPSYLFGVPPYSLCFGYPAPPNLPPSIDVQFSACLFAFLSQSCYAFLSGARPVRLPLRCLQLSTSYH